MVEKNNKSLTTVYIALGILVIISGFVAWLTNTHFTAYAAKDQAQDVHEVQRQVVVDVATIKGDINYIKEGQCDIKSMVKEIKNKV